MSGSLIKITVKHYLNKRAIAKVYEGKKFYPLYIQIITSTQKAQIKSKLCEHIFPYLAHIQMHSRDKVLTNLIKSGFFSEELLKITQREKPFPLYHLLTDEIKIFTRIIQNEREYKSKSFSLVNFSNTCNNYLSDIFHTLDKGLKAWYLNELNRIFVDSTSIESSRKLFKLTNYFIHYINWDKEFFQYYDTTYEVLPSEIKFIENYLSEDIRKAIKAGLAFYPKYNILKRYLDKTGKGKFPGLNYIDWQEEGRDFITKEFIKLFGKQVAIEFVGSIDQVLSKKVRGVELS